MVVDAHTHLLPARLAAKIRAFFDQSAELAGRESTGLAYPIDPAVLLDRLHADGVDAIWTLPYAHKPGMAHQLNVDIAALAAEHQDRGVTIVPGCTVHPGDPAPADDLRVAVDEVGARVLKLHCSVGDYRPTDDRLTPVFDLASARALPVVIHVGHHVDGTTQQDELADVDEVARRHPEARIIVAHLGYRATDAAIDLLDRHPNVHGDLTPVVRQLIPLRRHDAIRLADRLLFGSDSPNTGSTVPIQIEHLDRLDLAPAARAAILGGTADRLIAEVRASN